MRCQSSLGREGESIVFETKFVLRRSFFLLPPFLGTACLDPSSVCVSICLTHYSALVVPLVFWSMDVGGEVEVAFLKSRTCMDSG